MRLLVLALAACTGTSPDKSVPEETGSPAGDSGGPGSITPAEPVTDVCAQVLGGAADPDPIAIGFSRAYGSYRLFSRGADWLSADAALVTALAGDDPFSDALPAAFVAAAGEGCAVAAEDDTTLPTASATLEDGLAILRPGSGALSLPAGAEIVVVDTRGVPNTAEGDLALDAAAGLAFAADQDYGRLQVRRFNGFPIQWTRDYIYKAATVSQTLSLTATGATDLPLVFLVQGRLSPHAARLAGGLRVAGKATLVGEDLLAETAESTWRPVGGRGLSFGIATLKDAEGDVWPDLVPADVSAADPEAGLAVVRDALVDAPLTGDAARAALQSYENELGWHEATTLDLATRRATLVVAHGVLDRFYPYFGVVGQHIDDALLSGLDEVAGLADDDRVGMAHAIGHFMHELYDGHGFYGDWGGYVEPDGYLALQIEQVDGVTLVRESGHPEIAAGDTIIAVDGTDASAWYEEAMGRWSAATFGYRHDLATRELKEVYGSRTLTLQKPDGSTYDATPTPMTYEEAAAAVPWAGTLRPSGWLDDLGAPTIYHLNLNGTVTTAWSQVEEAIAAFPDASGVVIDMREYPAIDFYSLAPYLWTTGFASPTFNVVRWTGPDEAETTTDTYTYLPEDTAFDGPMVLLVSNKSVSAAENFSQMIYPNANVTVVGQTSAGTNGNITGALLPGQFYLMFTGMEVLNTDGTILHGTGIPLDVTVVPTAEDFAAGVDPELEAAVEVLSGAR